jgi:hypothetical protein
VVAREKHEGNESEDGDQGAPPLAIFPFEKFDTSLERFRGRPRISSASWFLGHDFTSLAGPYLRRVQIATYTWSSQLLFSSAQVGVRYRCDYQVNRAEKAEATFHSAKLPSQTAARSGFSDNIRKPNTAPRR